MSLPFGRSSPTTSSTSTPSAPTSLMPPSSPSSGSWGTLGTFAFPDSTKNMVKDTLKVVKSVTEMAAEPAGLSGVPGLKEGLAGVAKLLQKILDMKANVEGVEKLNKRIVGLVDHIQEIRGRAGNNELLQERQEEIERLMKKWEEIGARASNITQRPRIVRLLTSSDDVKDLQELVSEINISIQDSVVMKGVLNIEGYITSIIRNVDGIAKNVADVQEKVDRIERRLDATFMSTYAKKAQFDSVNVRRQCLEGTRTGLLDRLQAWVTAACTRTDAIINDAIIQWINGFAGTGKTTIAYTMVEYCKSHDFLAANFFCSRSDAECSDANLIFLTVSRQICHFHAPFKEKVEAVLKKDPDIAHAGIHRQFEELIVLPLEAVKDTFPKSVIIFDALDECLEKAATRNVLTTIARFVPRIGQYVVFIVTSRPEQHITTLFERSHQHSLKDSTAPIILHDFPLEQVEPDIKLYTDREFKDKATLFAIEEDWPSEKEKEKLVEMSHGLFIFIAAAIAFIMSEAYRNPRKRLQLLLDDRPASSASGVILSALYSQIITASYGAAAPELSETLVQVLGTVVLAQEPLSVVTVSRILALDENDIRNMLSGLKSVLSIPAGKHQPIHIIHPTFAEFLLQCPEVIEPQLPSPSTVSTVPYVCAAQQHWLLFSRCLTAMNTLDRDMIGIQHPARFTHEIEDFETNVHKIVAPHVRYACRYWVFHLREGLNSAITIDVIRPLGMFLEKSLLSWLETCSLLGITDKVVYILVTARKAFQTLGGPFAEFVPLVADVLRFALAYLPCIHAAPLAVYYSALGLSPTASTIRATYTVKPDHSLVVHCGIPSTWAPCIDTFSVLEGRSARVVAFHPDGSTFVTGWGKGLMIWNTYTRTMVLSVDELSWGVVSSVTFSPDGSHIAAGGDQGSISILQASSGDRIHSWEVGVRECVTFVVYSARGDRLLSTDDKGWVQLWEISSWRCLTTLCTCPGRANHVGISPDGHTIAYTGERGSIHLYDVPSKTTEALQLPKQLSREIIDASAFSPDGRYVAGATGKTILLWKSSDRSLAFSVDIGLAFSRFVFSPNSAYIVCGTSDGYITLCDVLSQGRQRLFGGEKVSVEDLAWSPDGIHIISVGTQNRRGKIQVWDVTQRRADTTEEHIACKYHSPPPAPPRFALVRCHCEKKFRHDGFLIHLPSLGIDAHTLTISPRMPIDFPAVTLTVDAPATAARLLRHPDWEYVTGNLPCNISHGCAISPDGLLMASLNATAKEVVVYSLRDGSIISTMPKHAGRLLSIVISPDSTRLVTGSAHANLTVWDISTGNPIFSHKTWSFRVTDTVFSSDSNIVAFGLVCSWSNDDRVLVHVLEITTHRVVKTSGSFRLRKYAMAFVDHNKHLLVLDDDCCGYVLDVETGAQLHAIRNIMDSISFSPDDSGIEFIDNVGNACKVIIWKPGTRNWPNYGVTRGGWVWAARPGRRERLCWVPPEWRDPLGWSGNTVCTFKVKGKGVVLDFGPLLDRVGFWKDI